MVRIPKLKRTAKKQTVNKFDSKFDTQGSYTGVVQNNPYEEPVQDADDL